MNRQEKLLKRFATLPKDFTFEEVISLFRIYGFTIDNKGATSGSRVIFRNEEKNMTYIMHRPHPGNTVKGYVMKQIQVFIENNRLNEQ